MIAATAVWAYVLLDRTSGWLPALRYLVLVAGLATAVVLALGAHRPARSAVVFAVVAALTGVAGTAAYAVDTAAQPHTGSIPTSGPSGSGMGGFGGGFGGGGPGGSSSSAVESLLTATSTRWAAATLGSQSAASLELATGTSVMAIGGFTGSDDSPTLAQFQQYVADGEVRYFISGGGMGGGPGGGGQSVGSAISSWVAAHFTATTVGGQTVYDLSK
jgi:4-amino-4-deoxy-L-arabinose transferase-like glycosyltransferase